MSKYRFLKSALFAFFLLSMMACSGNQSTAEKEDENLPDDIVELRNDQIKLANIELGTIEERALAGSLKVSGIVAVAPNDLATVSAPMGGFIKSTNLVAGNSLTKGQVLALIENQAFVDLQQSYLEAKNKFEFANSEYQRHTQLYKDDVYSQQNLQEVTANYKNLKVQMRALEQKLALLGINPANLHDDDISSALPLVSPISGFIKSVNINLGKSVTSTDILFEIINTSSLFIELTLFEKDASLVSIGQKINFFVNNETDVHQAQITQTGKSINADKTFKVYASVSATCPNLMPGMYVNALIQTTPTTAQAVPSNAIVSFNDKDYIFLFERTKTENGKPFTEYRMVEIQKGLVSDGYTQITLPANINIKNIKIVVQGAYNLLSAKKNAGEMSC